jgi:Na+-transporting NADH:ubiquinone oxidoreductase subunit C
MSGGGECDVPDDAKSGRGEAARPSRDSIGNTLRVAVTVSLVCSILVASVAVLLKPIQDDNARKYQQRIILEVANLMQPGADIDELSTKIEARMVELATGSYVDSPAPGDFDAKVAANDAEMGIAIPPEFDLANIHRRAIYAPVYLVRPNDRVEQIILPVYGSGLWSTMYGYLAVATDGVTVTGLRFYSHAETPGLGDQIDNPDWIGQWEGKLLFGSEGEPRIEVVRGVVQADAASQDAARFQVDGLSGATLTGRGVMRLIRYWVGPHGFGPYLERHWHVDGNET